MAMDVVAGNNNLIRNLHSVAGIPVGNLSPSGIQMPQGMWPVIDCSQLLHLQDSLGYTKTGVSTTGATQIWLSQMTNRYGKSLAVDSDKYIASIGSTQTASGNAATGVWFCWREAGSSTVYRISDIYQNASSHLAGYTQAWICNILIPAGQDIGIDFYGFGGAGSVSTGFAIAKPLQK